MTLRHLGIIGAGGISDVVMSTLAQSLPSPMDRISLLVRDESDPRAGNLLGRYGERLARSRAIHTCIDEFLSDGPDVVAECASHDAVRTYGEAVLCAGSDLVIVSVGALADDNLRLRLELAAGAGGGRVILPAGAIGGIDALSAAQLSGVESVLYTGCKPPNAWRGTPAEKLLDLGALQEPAIFFSGSARQAAEHYPFNANVTAVLALAGIGLDRTDVQLIADPGIQRNTHEFSVMSTCGNFTIKIEGRPSPANPKTSLLAGYSVARQLLNRSSKIVI